MWKIWLRVSVALIMLLPGVARADGVDAGVVDQTVVPIVRANPVTNVQSNALIRTSPATGQQLIFGSNQVGRPGVAPDQIGGYEAHIAYDHVAVGVGIMAVLFLMTEWMEAR